MGYGLGVDLGTTNTAAAVNVDGRVDPVRLGSQKAEIPSLVFLRADGGVLIGEAAHRRGQSEPSRLAREFKRRLGDPVPIMLGGAPFSAHALTARLLGQAIETVTRLHEEPPDRIVVTHPANWGPYKRELLTQAVQLADVTGVMLRPEPEAAAVRYAGTARVAPGEIVAVYDLGGGTFDAAVLRKTDAGFDLLGDPEGIEQLGGIDFDEAVLEHVRATLGDALAAVDPEDDEATEALARLRRDCVEAKETLSDDTEAVIAVALPRLHTRVRINRSQFETMIAPALDDTVAAMRRALRSADVRPEQLRCIVLAGGSARIPLVSELLSTAFERTVVLDETPELGIALGAAMLAGPSASVSSAGRTASSGPATNVEPQPPDAGAASSTLPTGRAPGPGRAVGATVIGRAAVPGTSPRDPADGPAPVAPAAVSGRPWRPYRWVIVGAVVAAVLAITAATAWPRGAPTGAAPSASAPPPAMSLLWQVPTGQRATGPPVGTADRIFIGGADGVIRALRRSDGLREWTFRTGTDRVLMAGVVDDLVYAGTADGVLYAIDARTGTQRWRTETGGSFDSQPAAYTNHVYAGGRNAVLYSYARGRSLLWQVRTGDEISTSPVAAGNIVVVASRDRRLYGVNVDGSVVWKPKIGQVVGNPVAIGRTVCVAVDDGSVRCLAAADGSAVSRIASAGSPLSAPVGDDGMVYAPAADGTVGAWDVDTGAQRWRLQPRGGVRGPGHLALKDAILHVAYPDGRLSAIDATSGVERWQFTAADRLETAPWADADSLFVVGATGTVYALRVPASTTVTPSPTAAPSTTSVTSPGRTTKPHPSRTRRPATTRPSSSHEPPSQPVSTTPTITPPTDAGPPAFGGNGNGVGPGPT
jgi:outer membrane protein assembly factor BamB/actin-like ATPase involved in cell morphogenesis